MIRSSSIFWGPRSPLAALFGLSFIIIAGGRTAFALTGALALLWVYGAAVLVFAAAARFFPVRGRSLIPVFLTAFLGGLFFLVIRLLNPLLALEMSLVITLVPVCCAGSGIFTRLEKISPAEALGQALGEAAVLGLLALALALIREPLGCASLSFPGGPQGIREISGGEAGEGIFPVHIAAAAAGGLLLLGYGLALFRHFRGRYGGGEDSP